MNHLGLSLFALAAVAYLLGSIPFGLLLTKWMGLGDIRAMGSGNIGATNVLRTGKKGLAALTLFLDAGKGAAAVLLARLLIHLNHGPIMPTDLQETNQAAFMLGVAGLSAFLGHLYPIWLKFKGGKGVATAFGIVTAISWPVGLICLVLWVVVAAVFRYSSLAALVAAGFLPIILAAAGWPELIWLAALMTLFIYIKHWPNIRRLQARTEGKIGQKD